MDDQRLSRTLPPPPLYNMNGPLAPRIIEARRRENADQLLSKNLPQMVTRKSDIRLASILNAPDDEIPREIESKPTGLAIQRASKVRSASTRPDTFLEAAQSDLYMEHIFITACLYGWAQVQHLIATSPRWKNFQEVDHNLGKHGDFPTRFASLILQKIWTYHSYPDPNSEEAKSSAPSWLWDLPCQQGVPKDSLIHIFPWPGLRLVQCQKLYAYGRNDAFLSDYLKYWRMPWPYALEDTIERSPLTGMLQFVPEFRRRMLSHEYWTFESDFFEIWPDFQGMAAKYEPQLAVYRLHDRTRAHEKMLRKATADDEIRRRLQKYYDSLNCLLTSTLGSDFGEEEAASTRFIYPS